MVTLSLVQQGKSKGFSLYQTEQAANEEAGLLQQGQGNSGNLWGSHLPTNPSPASLNAAKATVAPIILLGFWHNGQLEAWLLLLFLPLTPQHTSGSQRSLQKDLGRQESKWDSNHIHAFQGLSPSDHNGATAE